MASKTKQNYSKEDLKPIELNTKRANRFRKYIKLTKFPLFGYIAGKIIGVDNASAIYLPINKSINSVENEVMPLIIVEHFLKKASYIVVGECGCRKKNGCKEHDPNLGCTWFGEDARRIPLEGSENAETRRHITSEEAIERLHTAYESGLVPIMGRLRGEQRGVDALPDTGHFMSMCFCCSCCCVNSIYKHANDKLFQIFQRMEGVTVKVDRDKCKSCTSCFKVCIFDGMKMVDGKAMIDQDNCKGCGRCERTCPNGAISIEIEDFEKNVEKHIAHLESIVDVT
ncbi:MAG: hypothetical protein GY870_18295 [archaeon]|nr:hypothetical protein [archaeon]